MDGFSLESIQFLKGLDDGEPLFEAGGNRKRVAYRTTMAPSELTELLVDGLTSIGARSITVTNLRPHKFGAADGFRCELAFVTANGLEKQGLAAGGTVNGRLHLILYTGARLHYYEAYRESAEKIIQSVRMK